MDSVIIYLFMTRFKIIRRDFYGFVKIHIDTQLLSNWYENTTFNFCILLKWGILSAIPHL